MSPGEKAKIDQSMAAICDLVPTQAGSLHKRFMEEGFTRVEAMQLVMTWLHATCGGTTKS